MALKYFVVRQGFGSGTKGEYVFVISSEQEMRFRTAMANSPTPFTIIKSQSISAEDAVSELHQVLSDRSVLVISSHVLSSQHIAKLACEAHLRGVRMIGFEAALSELAARVGTESEQLVKTLMHGAVHQSDLIRLYSVLKSTLEPLVALAMLILLSPILLVASLAVKFSSPGPVFYRQTRVGHRGKLFELIKFRSMRTDAEKDGPVWASAKTNDARLSPIGGLLRATHLDELPQLWNVVRGDVSFIGPRPERPVFTDKLEKEIPLFRLRTLVKPGITGWAQVHQGYANSVDDSRVKLEYDFYYVLKHSPIVDAKVVLRTLGVLTTGGTEGKKRERQSALNGTGFPTVANTERQRPSNRLSLRRSLTFKLPGRRTKSVEAARESSRRIEG